MAIYKHTWFFEARARGWTESLYTQPSTTTLRDQWVLADKVAQKRQLLLGAEVLLKAIRVSVELNDAGQKVRGDSYLEYSGYKGVSTQEADEPDNGLQVIFRNPDGLKRKLLYLRGIWDAINVTGGAYKNDVAGWTTNFQQWVTELKNGNYGWLATDRAGEVEITGYTSDTNAYVTFTLGADLFGPGPYRRQQVRISGLNNRSELNGPLLVRPLSATSAVTVSPNGVAPFKTAGRMIRYSTFFVKADTISGQKIITRKTGAPPLQPRGRLRPRVRA